MTVQELLDELSRFDPDQEVRLAIQPSWPFEHNVGRVAEAYDQDPDSDDATTVVFIGEGAQLGYLSSSAREAVWA